MIVKAPASIDNLADLLDRLGGVPLRRIRIRPALGTATVDDLLRVRRQEGKVCELVEGVLVEKAVGYAESLLAAYLIRVLGEFVARRKLGMVTGEAGVMELMPDLVRIPDVAFVSWDRVPGRRVPSAPVPRLVPNLVVEVLSEGNTAGEMALKRSDYFAAGVELVWEVDPRARTVTAYTSLTDAVQRTETDVLDAGGALPGFRLSLHDLFGELDQHG